MSTVDYVEMLVRENKLTVWSEVVEKVIDGSRKEFWAFVGRRMKARILLLWSFCNEYIQGVSSRYYKGTLSIWG